LIQCSNENKKASSLFFICSQSVSSQGGSLTHISQSRHTMIFLWAQVAPLFGNDKHESLLICSCHLSAWKGRYIVQNSPWMGT